jgi:acyl-CoA dehydrogenase
VGRREVLGLRLNFSKRYITLAPVATLVGLAFRMRDPDGLLGEPRDYGITCALLPRDLPGMDIGRRHLPIGDNFFNGPIVGKDVFIPLSQIIGGPEMAGKGWTMLVNCLSVGRCITLPSAATGIAARALAGTTAYAAVREQFGLPIARFEGVQAPIARIAGAARIANAARLHTAQALDNGEKPSVASAILKYHCTELARVAINDALDVHGGKAVMRGPKNYLADFYGGTPIAITVEGANIMTRNLMIFGQGATRSHPLVLRQMRLAHAEPTPEVVRQFGAVMVEYIGFVLGTASRSLLMGLTGGRFAATPNAASPVSGYYRQLSRLSANFAMVSDASMLVLQGRLKFMEMLSARLGDLLSNLYLCSLVLKDYEDEGCPEEALPAVQWACDLLIQRYLTAYQEIIDNFPVRPVAVLLRSLSHPFGIRAKAPSDKLSKRVAALVTSNSQTRDAMISSAFVEPLGNNPLGLANEVFLESAEFVELKRRVTRAVKDGRIPRGMPQEQVQAAFEACVIDAHEADELRKHLDKVMDLVHVDEFASADAIVESRKVVGPDDDCTPLRQVS